MDPEVEATLRFDLGSTYMKLGSPLEAEPNLRRALTLRRRILGPDHKDTLFAEVRLSELLVAFLQQFAEAKPLALHAWQKLRKVVGEENRMTLDALNMYAASISHAGDTEEGERLAREYLRLCELAFTPDDHDTIVAMLNVALSAQDRGDYAEAERLSREAQRRFDRSGQSNQTDAFWNTINLSAYRWFQGDLQEAETLLSEARPRAVQGQGDENTVTLHIGHLLARVLADQGKLDQSIPLEREILEKRKKVVPASEAVGKSLLALARMLVMQGEQNYPEAERLLNEALPIFRENYAMKPELAAQAENALGAIHLAQKSYQQAESLLLASPDLLLTPAAQMSRKEQETAIGYIVELYRVQGKPAEAQVWQDKLAAFQSKASKEPSKPGPDQKR
jgi:tetratricopeptide (TPR) repeat protein